MSSKFLDNARSLNNSTSTQVEVLEWTHNTFFFFQKPAAEHKSSTEQKNKKIQGLK